MIKEKIIIERSVGFKLEKLEPRIEEGEIFNLPTPLCSESSLVVDSRLDLSKLCAICPRVVAPLISQSRPELPNVLSSRCSLPESVPFDS